MFHTQYHKNPYLKMQRISLIFNCQQKINPAVHQNILPPHQKNNCVWALVNETCSLVF